MTSDFVWGVLVGGGLTLFFVVFWIIINRMGRQSVDPEDPADWWKKN